MGGIPTIGSQLVLGLILHQQELEPEQVPSLEIKRSVEREVEGGKRNYSSLVL